MSVEDTNTAPETPGSTPPPGVLPAGHRVAEFRIERVLGQGGFGIVYLAFDTRLERRVALKEFMPRSLAQRLADGSVVPLSERHRATFDIGLRSFIREARGLAQFKHPALVEVYRFWEELGTAYMVMPFYEGQTLTQRLQGMAAVPPEPWLRQLAQRVLQGLDAVHQQGWLHRDIAPDNILLLPGDQPVLLDFGSARHDIGGATQALGALLKPGYAPFEQYSDSAALKQGPWTDLYAFGALLYFAISGRVPVAAVERVERDTLVSAQRVGRGRYSTPFLQFIDHCLAVWPEQRPRSIAAALDLLRRLDRQEPARHPDRTGHRRRPAGLPSLSNAVAQTVGFLSRWQRPLSWAGGVAVLGVALVGLASWRTASAPVVYAQHHAPAAQPMRSQPPVAPPIDTTAAAAVVAKAQEAASLSAPPPAAEAPPSSVPPARLAGPATPEAALVDLLHERDARLQVNVALAPARQPGRLQFNVRASEPGYLYVFATGAPHGRLELLWPKDDQSLVMIEPGQTWTVDAAALPSAASAAAKRQVGVMVSRSARHLAAAGWQRQAGMLGKSFSTTPDNGSATPWFGLPSCMPVPGPCSAGFGAVRFDMPSAMPSPVPTSMAAAQPASRKIHASAPPRWRQAAARKAECDSLAHLLWLDGNSLAQRRFAQLGCRR